MNSFWDSGIEPYPYDPDQAMALLDEAGYTDADGDGVREGTCNGETVPLSAFSSYERTVARDRVNHFQQFASTSIEESGGRSDSGTSSISITGSSDASIGAGSSVGAAPLRASRS